MAAGDSSEKKFKKIWNILGLEPAGCPVWSVLQCWECEQAPTWFDKKWLLGHTTEGPTPSLSETKLSGFAFCLSFSVPGNEARALHRPDMHLTTQPILFC